MSASFKNPVLKILQPLALVSLSLAMPFVASAGDEQAGFSADRSSHNPPVRRDSSPLVAKVRRATERFQNINSLASDPNWVRATPCVSGPNEGAMGVHYVNVARLHDGTFNAEEPEALIYEPLSNGSYKLVGVEFIAIASEWAEKHKDSPDAADLEGHLTNYVGAPNRYGLPPFFELHVWAWEDNPKGNFADWNTQVSCDKQKAPVL